MIPQSDAVHILSAVRTPIGSLNGALSSLKAHELGSQVIREAVVRSSIAPEDVSEVIIGQALTAAQGQNPARQAALGAGLPYTIPAYSVNMVCGSGLRSVVLGYQSIKCGDASVIISGGQESMSQAPHACFVRKGIKMGPTNFIDTMTHDGLTDAFNNYHMGITEQDIFAVKSQQKTEAAMKNNDFKQEILPIVVQSRNGSKVVSEDEFPRHSCTLEALSKLNPCFVKDGTGTVTAGNSSGVNDGAAALVLASESEVKNRHLQPMATIISWGQGAVDPAIMGYGPVPAVKNALSKANWTKDDVDLWEVNEAFAVQSLVVIRALGLDEEKVNVSGGSVSLGHPIGASGARILVTLLHNLKRLNKKKGVACLCIGGGMGIALCVETV
ncbi:Acetyl-CoA acetyltransferase, cytosolic [Armadillidium nasatum]|uniref:Acetyl-CoA acetyltransferase, cytosolic n=1 Tax=Armadillidium nasatum TaxID=96803 RepID=A0A5N5SPY4_9CRUS|nr:Acetyl-CoA acetyltransferase, cytosolic [Armadillidium nasatum]